MTKIGRNDPCPCGSGNKYKKCCLGKDETRFKKTPNEGTADPLLSGKNTIELVKTFSGLSLLRENHGKYYRLEQLITKALLSFNSSSVVPSPQEIKEFLDKKYPSNSNEDACVNPFTETITFHGGGYTIYPGITENMTDILSDLLTSLYHRPWIAVPDQFKVNVRHLAGFILEISDTIAKRLGHGRYLSGEVTESRIYVPESARLEVLKTAVTFSQEEMKELLSRHDVDEQVVELFVLQPEKLSQNALTSEYSPIAFQPLIKDGGDFIVLSPSTLSAALNTAIWKMAAEFRCAEALADGFHKTVWQNMQLELKQLGFEPTNVDGFGTSVDTRDGFYTFDEDKIAYVHYLGDPASNYLESPEYGSVDASKYDRFDLAVTALRKSEKYAVYKVLSVTVISGIGRTLMLPLKKRENAQALHLFSQELKVLWQLGETDAVDLWKFTIARDELLSNFHGLKLHSNFIDQFKLYRENKDSFYLSDEGAVFPTILPGYAKDWLLLSRTKPDVHSAVVGDGEAPSYIEVYKKDSYAPIYVNREDLVSSTLQFLVEGFPQPVWVSPLNMEALPKSGLRQIYWELNDAIAYWLWQVQKDIYSEMQGLGEAPIMVTFDLNPVAAFEEIKRDYKRDPNLENQFSCNATGTGFHVTIPGAILPYLYGAENEGERVLVKSLLKGLNQLLAAKGQPELSAEKIQQIIESNAPLGMKKKFFIIDTANNLLVDPTNIGHYRYVQEYDVSVVLDSVVPALGSKCPPVGEIKTKQEKNDLAREIAGETLRTILESKLKSYDSVELLKKLISLNESLIRKRELLRIKTPTRIACFVSAEQHAEELWESITDVDKTTIAVRCLIEHIAAVPSAGTNTISTTAIDELLAIMDQIIAWGSISDQIHFDLFDIAIGITASGRVGTEKKFYNEVLDPYYTSKSQEKVKDAVNAFSQIFPTGDEEGAELPPKLDRAFLTDYGVSLSRILAFMGELAHIGFMQPNSYAMYPLDKLRAEVNKHVQPFNENEYNSVINYLSLEERGDVRKLPKGGYEFIDIMPWRFNRMLSLLRKPLIITNQPGTAERIAYWGPRQVLASRIYLSEQCKHDRLRLLKGATAIKSALGDFAKKRGDALVDAIVKSIDPAGLIIDTELFIAPNRELKHTDDIGDIDVLIIDPAGKVLYSIESKAISPTRNIKEMIEEVDKLLDIEKGWIPKHMKRHDWITKNLDQLGKKFFIDLTGYDVKSFFVTEEDMLTPYLKKMELPLPFLTRYEVEEGGFQAFKKKKI